MAFRALRNTGVALSVSLTALAVYQGVREAVMADRQPPRPASAARLDAAGERQVLYCHQCTYEWYQNEQGLKCPVCEGEIVEMVSYISSSLQRPKLTSY